ncbi:MAG: TldD/PmbA family protein [Dysgonamonadaceae bacterium]|jgi:PmbA protein|nr:TldD/PmbA family protein [Dysgonamonadaceae bacterium]
MISQAHKELAQWALKYALEKGCSDASVKIYAETESSFEYRDTQLDKLEQSAGNGLTIRLYVDGKYASFSTNRLEKKELEKFIAGGIETTRFLAKDEFRKLPDSSRLYKGDGKGLDLYDKNIDNISVDEKLALIKSNVNEVYRTDDRLISVSSDYSDGTENVYLVASNGFEGETETTWFSLSAETSMKGEGDARPESYWYDSAVNWDKLQKQGIGKTAYERTLRKFGQEKIESGVFPMIVDNLSVGRLLSPVISAMYGSAIQQKSSFLIDKLGQPIISDKITIIDDPHIRNARGARWFDDEGVATRKADIVRNGVLNMYFIDTYYGGKLNMELTVQSPSILTLHLGSRNFDQILTSIDKGIWVTGFNGGNSNATTGDFSFGIEGFLIENGKAVKPINEMNITGNLLTLWQQVIEVGNDPRTGSNWRIPCVLFDKVNFSGK